MGGREIDPHSLHKKGKYIYLGNSAVSLWKTSHIFGSCSGFVVIYDGKVGSQVRISARSDQCCVDKSTIGLRDFNY